MCELVDVITRFNRQKQDKRVTKEPLHFRSYLAELPAAVAGEGVDGVVLLLLLLLLVGVQPLLLVVDHELGLTTAGHCLDHFRYWQL